MSGTVMWDHDGVISDWVGNFYPWICAKEGWEPSEWRIWHHYRNHEMHDQEFVARLTEYAEQGGFGDQRMNPGVRDAVCQIARFGYTQHVVTDRPAVAEADTAWWLDTFLPEIDSMTVSRDKTIFKEFGPPSYYAIDDRIENVETMRKAGIFAYLLTQPWNEDSDLPRVATVGEFADRVCGIWEQA